MRDFADHFLFPEALNVDRAEFVPPSHFAAFRDRGLYDFDGDPRTVEELASGCLTTTFVWLQHLGPRFSAAEHEHLRDRWAGPLARGDLLGGIARAGARPGAEALTVRSTADGFVLDGSVPWVTGWGMIDIVEVAAIDGDDIVFIFVDAADSPTLQSRLNQLVAVQASRTVTLTFKSHHVPADRFVRRLPLKQWQESEAAGSRLNGALALGVASRCLRLMDADVSELDACRDALAKADNETLPNARAAASELAMRAASTLTVHTGSRSVLMDNHAQRLVREAAFLLVFGTRKLIRDALLPLIGNAR